MCSGVGSVLDSQALLLWPWIRRTVSGSVVLREGHKCRLHRLPQHLRHSYLCDGLQRGVDAFTLQPLLGDGSTRTTGHHVAFNPRNSHFLRLGQRALLM